MVQNLIPQNEDFIFEMVEVGVEVLVLLGEVSFLLLQLLDILPVLLAALVGGDAIPLTVGKGSTNPSRLPRFCFFERLYPFFCLDNPLRRFWRGRCLGFSGVADIYTGGGGWLVYQGGRIGCTDSSKAIRAYGARIELVISCR